MDQAPGTEATSAVAWNCPKDGTPMVARGRRGGVRRCPVCRGVFLDVETLRGGRWRQPPMWLPVVWSIALSVGMTLLVRRLKARTGD
jgi:hypothetical protein